MISERSDGGKFVDFYDWCSRVDPMVLNKRTVESLIKAGAFDSLGHPRQGLVLVYEAIIDRTLARRREADQGVMSLFGDLGAETSLFDDARVAIPDQDFDKTTRLAFEKEMLGLYLSDHPLKGLEGVLARRCDVSVAELRDQASREGAGEVAARSNGYRGRDGDVRTVGGVVTGLVRKYTKRGDLMATFSLEDLSSAIDVWVFPKTMAAVGHLLADDAVVVLKGRLDQRDETPKLICMDVERVEARDDGVVPLHIKLPMPSFSADQAQRLRAVLSGHPGLSPVLVHLGDKCLRLPSQFSVEPTGGLTAELRELLGPNCLSLT
jgi:DNA polymerase-3 subunit alpha